MDATPRPMTETYESYRAGKVTFEELKRRVERATEDYKRSCAEAEAAGKAD
jgi:hypothetical protein